MWPTSEQTACTLAGGIPELRQITSNCGNKLVRCRLRLQSRLQTFSWAAWLLRIIPKWFNSTGPASHVHLGLPSAGCLDSLSVNFMALSVRDPNVWTCKSSLEGTGHRKWQYLCNLGVRSREERNFDLLVSTVRPGKKYISGRQPWKEWDLSQREFRRRLTGSQALCEGHYLI